MSIKPLAAKAYFTCRAFFNACVGTTILEVGEAFGIQYNLLRLTGAKCRALVPAEHLGNQNELWYVRVLPPPPTRQYWNDCVFEAYMNYRT